MVSSETLDKIKQGFVAMTLGIILSVVPFYFQTKTMTEDHDKELVEQTNQLKVQEERLNDLEVQSAVDNVEIEQIKTSLYRIEKKIDRLIERGN